jgi:hypothetical protein
MPNVFDQFDTPIKKNVFDQFDTDTVTKTNPAVSSSYTTSKTPEDDRLYFGGQLPAVTTTSKREPVGKHFTDDEIKLLVGDKPAQSIYDKNSDEVQRQQKAENTLGFANQIVYQMPFNPLSQFLSGIKGTIQTGTEAVNKGNVVPNEKNPAYQVYMPTTLAERVNKTILANTEIPFQLGMSTNLGGLGFQTGSEIANQVLPKDISKWQAPITTAINSQTETSKSLASLGDMVLQLALANYIGKGVKVLKGNPLLGRSELNYLNNEMGNELLEPNSGSMDINTKSQESNIIEGGESVGANTQRDEFSKEKNKKGFKENQNQKKTTIRIKIK